MPVKYEPDRDTVDPIPGVDRHFYRNQVLANSSSSGETLAFQLAAADAKDRARHEMIKAVRAEAAKASGNFNTLSGRAAATDNERRTIDGVTGAPDDAIKL